jgi:hypothetical protein
MVGGGKLGSLRLFVVPSLGMDSSTLSLQDVCSESRREERLRGRDQRANAQAHPSRRQVYTRAELCDDWKLGEAEVVE